MASEETEDVNSLGAYVRSIRRASAFRDMRPRLRQSVVSEDEEAAAQQRHSQHYESGDDPGNGYYAPRSSLNAGHASLNEQSPLLANANTSEDEDSTFLVPLHSKVQGAAQRRIAELAEQREETQAQMKEDDREPLLVAKVTREDGTEAEVIVGQSTLPQTIFNSSNVLVGVGILSLPLGIKYAGWVIGLLGLIASALVSKYTAGLLAKCIDVDSSLANFGDVAYVAFGEKGRIATSSLITLELMVACVGLVILFADTLGSLIDGPTPAVWKILCGCILAPLQFLPLSLLGFSSFLGIFCNLLIIGLGLVLGLTKMHSPGSLREVATTHAFPPQWRALPLSFGLIMGTCRWKTPYLTRELTFPKHCGAVIVSFQTFTGT